MAVDAELFADTLPTYLTRFVGREAEAARVAALLKSSAVVTVCGVGGAGKTRLAIEVAKRLRADPTGTSDPLEVYWVPLAGVLSPAELLPAVATALGLTGSLAEHNAAPIVSALRTRRALLLLDNCEHVTEASRALVAQVVASCPALTVLATSRIPLGLAGEAVYAIPPLGGAARPFDPCASDATELFVDRAATVAPPYAMTDQNARILGEICDVLHGLPLAIELAASWIPVLSPRDLLEHITRTNRALISSSAWVEERHRSMLVVLDTSWQWLATRERAVLSALGVFVGGFTREAAEVVAGADLASLARLSELSLIQRLPDSRGGSRYQVHELVRTYALDRLDDPETVRERHLTFFLDLVESLETSWDTPVEPLWSDPIGADLANIDAATAWALRQRDAERALRMAVGPDRFWIFSYPSAALRLRRLTAALALPDPPTSVAGVRARAQALHIAGLRVWSVDPSRALPLYADAQRLFEQIGDAAGVAACIRDRGSTRLLQGDTDGCRRDVLEGLARCRACGDHQGEAWCALILGCAALVTGNYQVAVTKLQTAAQQFETLRSPFGACHAQGQLALAHQLSGQWLEAVEACQRSLAYQQTYRFTAERADTLEIIARVAAELRRYETAAQLYGAAAGWRDTYEQVSWFPLAANFHQVGSVRRHLGDQAWAQAYGTGQHLDADAAVVLAEEVLASLREEFELSSSGLTHREIDVLRLVADVLGNAEIAHHLVLSPRTVHAHLRSIYEKLGVTSRTAAVRAAGVAVTAAGPRRERLSAGDTRQGRG